MYVEKIPIERTCVCVSETKYDDKTFDSPVLPFPFPLPSPFRTEYESTPRPSLEEVGSQRKKGERMSFDLQVFSFLMPCSLDKALPLH